MDSPETYMYVIQYKKTQDRKLKKMNNIDPTKNIVELFYFRHFFFFTKKEDNFLKSLQAHPPLIFK